MKLPRRSEQAAHKVQAAVLRKKGQPLKIESLELEGPRDDEVLVRIVASGICHTDIDMCEDWDSADTPVVLGHEGAGVVKEVGKQVKGATPGRSCRALLPVLRKLPAMPKWTSHRL